MEHRVASTAEIQPGSVHLTTVAGRRIGVFRVDDRFFALRDACPHMGGPLCRGFVGGTMLPSDPGDRAFGMRGDVIRCPWHGWEFALATGEALFGISQRAARVYPVAVRDGQVYVRV